MNKTRARKIYFITYGDQKYSISKRHLIGLAKHSKFFDHSFSFGPKDIDNNTIEVARRDNLTKEVVDEENIEDYVDKLLLEIQKNLFNKAKKFREANTHKADNYEEFKKIFKNQNGFVYAHWDGSSETENKIKKETKATIRCIPLDYGKETGKCIVTGKKSKGMVVFGKAY